MPRRKRLRKVVAPPDFKGFKPYGIRQVQQDHVELLYEEYEAIKLADYDMKNHQDASVIMGVSRATFARIYESARRKMAKALVETREIKSVFGNAVLDKSWLVCDNCHARFTLPPTADSVHCPLCRSEKIHAINNK